MINVWILFGIHHAVFSQSCTTPIANCNRCDVKNNTNTCLSCVDGFGTNINQTLCCSVGCSKDFLGFPDCAPSGECQTSGCDPAFYGANCSKCSSRIQNCDTCTVVDTNSVHCTKCVPGFEITSSGQACCLTGCDSCTGENGRICTSCMPSYYLYGQTCDVCGDNCMTPTNGTSRCDPVTGSCYFGCKQGWHGSKCNIPCNIKRCDTCIYMETTNNLTCMDCQPGYYGPYCQACSYNCQSSNNDVCHQNGTCILDCQPGWTRANCDISCDAVSGLGNCLDCERYRYVCTVCKPGFYDQSCQSNCSSQCVPDGSGKPLCSITDGTCTFGCLIGYWKNNCSGTCPNCGYGNCNRTTGNCLIQECNAGFFGANCNSICPEYCEVNPITGMKFCDFNSGACTYGCKFGHWGSTCSSNCSVNCKPNGTLSDTVPKCNQNNGACLYTCNNGYYQPNCTATCLTKCVDNTCDVNLGTCQECAKTNPGYLCSTGNCPIGKKGIDCSEDCPSKTCLFNQCERYNGICKGCATGVWGDLCDTQCPNCKTGTECEQNTGYCIQGCKDGHYGNSCNKTCDSLCSSCERQSGACIKCAAGRWGQLCGNVCSSNCQSQNITSQNIIYCEKVTGNCLSNACKPGFWREDCLLLCNNNCKPDRNGNLVCAFQDGHCTNGCKDAFYGSTCSQNCSERCKGRICKDSANKCTDGCANGYYGTTCDETCSVYCALSGIPAICNSTSGNCFANCTSGYYGDRCIDPCKNTCLDGTCDSNGGCPDCRTDPIGVNCRVQECTPGLYGPTCESKCPGHCTNNICHRQIGTCLSGCIDNLYGSYCTESCQCDISGTAICNYTNGDCVCKPDHYDIQCNQNCSDGCRGRMCSKNGACLDGCKLGRYGTLCRDSCSNCLNSDCNESNGTCNQGCIDGWYTDTCTTVCPSKCTKCDFKSSACSRCAQSYYQPITSCSETCSSNCGSAGSGRICNETDGQCLYHCRVGYYGPKCDRACGHCIGGSCNRDSGNCSDDCSVGYWGDVCQMPCNGNCARSVAMVLSCDKMTGNCDFGCIPQYFGLSCNSPCSSNCKGFICDRITGICVGCKANFYGENCSSTCDNCKYGICLQANGSCEHGCVEGRFGNQCQHICTRTCRDNACDQIVGDCIDCTITPKGSQCRDTGSFGMVSKTCA